MKLIFCPTCHDIVRLKDFVKKCDCGKVFGRYIDEINIEVSGNPVVLGLSNPDFKKALQKMANLSKDSMHFGPPFESWIIPSNNNRIKHV